MQTDRDRNEGQAFSHVLDGMDLMRCRLIEKILLLDHPDAAAFKRLTTDIADTRGASSLCAKCGKRTATKAQSKVSVVGGATLSRYPSFVHNIQVAAGLTCLDTPSIKLIGSSASLLWNTYQAPATSMQWMLQDFAVARGIYTKSVKCWVWK